MDALQAIARVGGHNVCVSTFATVDMVFGLFLFLEVHVCSLGVPITYNGCPPRGVLFGLV